jgi:hypothetical protein
MLLRAATVQAGILGHGDINCAGTAVSFYLRYHLEVFAQRRAQTIPLGAGRECTLPAHLTNCRPAQLKAPSAARISRAAMWPGYRT